MIAMDQPASFPTVIDTTGMSLAEMEERLNALAQQRAALLSGMKDKLPDEFDPVKFDFQGQRALGLDPVDAKKATEGSSVVSAAIAPEMSEAVSGALGMSDNFQFTPSARRTRMSGVSDVLKSGPDTLRGQVNSSLGPAKAKAKAVAPKTNTAFQGPKLGVGNNKTTSQVPAAGPGKSTPRTPRPKATSVAGTAVASGDQPKTPRTSPPDASSTQQRRSTGRQVSSSPSRGRAGVYGVGKDPVAGKESRAGKPVSGRQASDSPSRNRGSLYGIGKDVDASKEKPGGRQVSSSPARNRSAMYGASKDAGKGPRWK